MARDIVLALVCDEKFQKKDPGTVLRIRLIPVIQFNLIHILDLAEDN